MSARKIDADEALRLGMVGRLVPANELMTTAYAYARDLADNVSPRAMAVIKRQHWAVGTQTLREAINIGNRELAASFSNEDFKEDVAHFVEKRPAAFTGRRPWRGPTAAWSPGHLNGTSCRDRPAQVAARLRGANKRQVLPGSFFAAFVPRQSRPGR